MPGHDSSSAVRFGVFEANIHTGELRRNGQKIKLQEQPFQLLTALLERPGEVVTREELRARLWPEDTFVDFDHSLNAAVRRLRDTLGESAETPRFVETVARRGYRFIAPVDSSAGIAATTGPEKPRLDRQWPVVVGISILLLGGIIVGFHAGRHSAALPSIQEKRLTANPIDTPVLSGVISPDGKYLTFADKTGFYLRQIDSGETHAVSLPQGFNAFPSAWYPDGIHLIATRVEEPKSPSSLWQVSITGGTPRKLIDDGGNPSVS